MIKRHFEKIKREVEQSRLYSNGYIKREMERNSILPECIKREIEGLKKRGIIAAEDRYRYIYRYADNPNPERATNAVSDNDKKRRKNPKQTLCFSCSFTDTERQNLFNGLRDNDYIPMDTNFNHFAYVFGNVAIPDNEKPFKPLQWIKENSRSGLPNKKSLLDLLCILDIPDNEINNKTLLNSFFVFPGGNKLHANNYTDITDNKRNLKKPIVSEYHNELLKITEKIISVNS